MGQINLLCLLSTQHVPNLLSIHHYRPTQIILVQTQHTARLKLAEHLLRALRLSGLDYTDRHDIVALDPEQPLSAMVEIFLRVIAQTKGDWVVNITGGTKPMALAAYEAFRQTPAKLVYTDSRFPAELWDMREKSAAIAKYKPSVEVFLAGYGYECQSTPADLETWAESRANLARMIAQYAPERALIRLGQKRTLKNNALVVEPKKLRHTLAETLDLSINGKQLEGEVQAKDLNFLAGLWLEVFLWMLLRDFAVELNISDVRLALKPSPVDSETVNDFDVSFIRDYTLWVAECKTGPQKGQSPDKDLYKLQALTRQFQALRVRSMYVTTSSNVLDKQASIRPAISSRAKLFNCRIIDRKTIHHLAAPNTDADRVSQLLFQDG